MRKLSHRVAYCLAGIGAFFFSDQRVRELIPRFGNAGAMWILNALWFQKVLGFNRRAPYPMHFTQRISRYDNLDIPLSSFNNLQAPGVYFQNFLARISLGEDCYIAPHVGFITANHEVGDLHSHSEGKEIIIGDRCWIGMNAVIMPGVILGSDTVVGAGAVVTKSFPAGKVVLGGVPAKPLKNLP